MHKSFKTFILIAIVLVTCALAIYPPKKNLRLGRDLAGGVNLVYSVNLNQGDNADEVIGRMIEVLKERVNPEGLYEISFVQQGRDRISISMPLPTKEIQQLRDKFQNAMSDLEDYVIDRGAFERALRLSGPERLAALVARAPGVDDDGAHVGFGPRLYRDAGRMCVGRITPR